MIKFLKFSDAHAAEEFFLKKFEQVLMDNSKVLWLVSGGSNINVAVNVAKKIKTAGYNKSQLKMLISDERYGKINHPDSNYYQLKSAGFPFDYVESVPVLSDNNLSFEETVNSYDKELQSVVAWADFIVGQFGIGTDGHTIGILPESIAASSNKNYVVGYQGSDFWRITVTGRLLKLVNKTFVFALGQNKKAAIEKLATQELSTCEQPAQIYKELDNVYIINSILGDEV